MKLYIVLFSAIFFVFSACSSTGKQMAQEKPAIQLLQDGEAAYNKGRYKKALEHFENLRNWYAFEAPYAMIAELRIADANYYLKQYPEAIAAYEDFERLHPRNEAIPYVIFQIGQSYFEQIDSVDRDQLPAQKAYDAYSRLVDQFPSDAYSRTALTQMEICQKSLAGHDIYVAKFYMKSKKYEAALYRFLSIVEKYPDVGLQYDALLAAAKCRAYLSEPSEKK